MRGHERGPGGFVRSEMRQGGLDTSIHAIRTAAPRTGTAICPALHLGCSGFYILPAMQQRGRTASARFPHLRLF